ncbi:PP2C family protein-serine/threonine phosphatase [Nocardioides kongjuensis]|uniref:PP2C family protein-serine/threonine phosphatase n=1 Tax=Nocardioides kongjuensis TaxID=349522 RepID=UPI002483A58F|nr:protein phosphatase 2C domain-containing protein [Nocardioides kongjuensis]
MGAASHTGRVRRLNEDAYLARRHLALVADGMGGHACGDVASAFAVEALALIADREQLRPEDVQEAIERANATILDASREPGRSGMGTTLSGVALVDFGGSPHWLVFNIGDSRVYRIAGGTASRLTVDHSEVAELVALGKISEEDAHHHPLRHVITRALGSDPAPVADVWIFPLAPAGDLFVACSDGLTNELDDTRIAAIVEAARGPRDAAAMLVEAAVEAGGHDNVTAVVVSAPPTTDDDLEVATTPKEHVR